MRRRPVIVEVRQRSAPFRRNPEQILIACEAGDESAAAARAERLEREQDRQELNDAYIRYARRHGWPEARGWAAAQAHFDPTAGQGIDHAAVAEQLFVKKRRAA